MADRSKIEWTLRPDKLDQPLRWKKPRRVFVNSMSDLFHADIPDEYIARVFAVMALAPHHTFQVLTKRHGRMRSLLRSPQFRDALDEAVDDVAVDANHAGSLPRYRLEQLSRSWWRTPYPLGNVWLGVSVEDQKRADLRIPALLDTPAAVRFLSCEPLLGPVDLVAWLGNGYGGDPREEESPLDWVIVGGESGHGARPMHIDWARSLRDQCETADVPYFFKQWGDASAWRDREGTIWYEADGDRLVYRWSDADFVAGASARERIEERFGRLVRVGNKAAGRELDGLTWDEYPSTRP